MITIKLITEDFKGSDYSDPCGCPLFKALTKLGYNITSVAGLGEVDTEKGFISVYNMSFWNSRIATPLIQKANNGEEVFYELEIDDSKLIKSE
jgi:hypothetical protein